MIASSDGFSFGARSGTAPRRLTSRPQSHKAETASEHGTSAIASGSTTRMSRCVTNPRSPRRSSTAREANPESQKNVGMANARMIHAARSAPRKRERSWIAQPTGVTMNDTTACPATTSSIVIARTPSRPG
jgi:hypothetical protein